jgi:hypothetical protein
MEDLFVIDLFQFIQTPSCFSTDDGGRCFRVSGNCESSSSLWETSVESLKKSAGGWSVLKTFEDKVMALAQTYSGKKKRHTRKVEMIMQDNGKILSVSHSHGGRKHDFRIRKEETPLPLNTEKYVDLGYQGLQKITSKVTLPFKRKKGQRLTKEQKQHNRKLASFRMKIEHKFREIKIFKIMSETYRNFGKKHHLRFNIIAGIINMKHGF